MSFTLASCSHTEKLGGQSNSLRHREPGDGALDVANGAAPAHVGTTSLTVQGTWKTTKVVMALSAPSAVSRLAATALLSRSAKPIGRRHSTDRGHIRLTGLDVVAVRRASL